VKTLELIAKISKMYPQNGDTVVFTTPKELTEEEFHHFNDQLIKSIQPFLNGAKVLLVDGGVEVKRISLYVVGKYLSGKHPRIKWEFRGIYSSREKAKEACKSPEDFYQPIALDEELKKDNLAFPNHRIFPILQKEKTD
jgi:hypothetical protein